MDDEHVVNNAEDLSTTPGQWKPSTIGLVIPVYRAGKYCPIVAVHASSHRRPHRQTHEQNYTANDNRNSACIHGQASVLFPINAVRWRRVSIWNCGSHRWEGGNGV